MAEEKPRYLKPLPSIDEESRPWWEALKRHELYIQKCRACGALRYYPRALCPECLSSATEWLRVAGKGRVYTFTVTRQNQLTGFRESLPYVLAYVELEDGVKLLTNIVDCKPEEAQIGMAVEAVFDDVTGEVTLLKFRPARA
jgi:uncharacterized protein